MSRGKDGGDMAQKGHIPRNFGHFEPKTVGSGGDSEMLGLVLFWQVCLNDMGSGGVLGCWDSNCSDGVVFRLRLVPGEIQKSARSVTNGLKPPEPNNIPSIQALVELALIRYLVKSTQNPKTKTTAPRIPMWSPTMVLTERYPT